MDKRVVMVGLVGVNLVLLAALLFVSPGPQAAVAQSVSQGGNYMVVTGKIYDDHDALYLIDLNTRTLHAFTFSQTRRQLEYRGARSLLTDFRRTPVGAPVGAPTEGTRRRG